LRKRQADVHVQAVTTHVRAGRMDAAHAFFEEALKYDTDHHEAHEQLARLSGAAVP
jgi:Tfp pilus assembly protein PilF